MKLSIVIPCLNEEEAIPKVLERIKRVKSQLLAARKIESLETIVVDDGSRDRSVELLTKNKDIKILKSPGPHGYGNAIKYGIVAAEGDYVCIFDMDGTYDPMDIPRFIEALETEKVKAIVGKRIATNNGMPKLRKLGNLFYINLIGVLFRKKLQDPCSGMWMIDQKLIQSHIERLPGGLDFTLSLSLFFLKNKQKFGVIPINYDERSGDSKLSVVTDGIQFLTTIISHRFLSH